jgi:mycobactin lysine-N-oxygenase
MSARSESVLAVIGAGPKGLASAVKSQVLREHGLPATPVVVVEKSAVAAHWSGDHGYTNGAMKLGTSPEKDVVFPLATDVGEARLTRRIRTRLSEFSWNAFLVDQGDYADWVDRGRPTPSHARWAAYLNWVAQQLEPGTIVNAEVMSIDRQADTWHLTLRDALGGSHATVAGRLMLTGPGATRAAFIDGARPLERTYDLESFWQRVRDGRLPQRGCLAIVGAGENAASALLALCEHAPHLDVEVISPTGYVSTRAENSYENRFFSDPERNGWCDLHPSDRHELIGRADLGVFSVYAMQTLNDERRHRIVPGRVTACTTHGQSVMLDVDYHGRRSRHHYDHVVLATGFDQLRWLRTLLAPRALSSIEESIGGPLDEAFVREHIERDLSLRGLTPRLHLPMLAGLTQGPGFANLSCLGLLTDRVLTEPALARRRAPPPAMQVAS